MQGGHLPRAQVYAAAAVRETLTLRSADIWKNLVVLVGVPYLLRKLDAGYETHVQQRNILGPGFRQRGGDEALPPGASVRQRLLAWYKWFLRKVYPSIHAAYYAWIIAFHLAYLSNKSQSHTPLLWLVGTRVRRLGEEDRRSIARAEKARLVKALARSGSGSGSGSGVGGSVSLLSPRAWASAISFRASSSVRLLLPFSVFVLNFLEWWRTSEFRDELMQKVNKGVELPPPIVANIVTVKEATKRILANTSSEKEVDAVNDQRLEDADATIASRTRREFPISSITSLPILTVPLPSASDLCPICLSPIITPTAAQTGFVFCYTCIHKWIQGDHERQRAFMHASGSEEGWGEEEGSRAGRWESGQGRCAVTGLQLLGGTSGLRRVVV